MGKRHLLHVRSSQYNTPGDLTSGPKLPTKDDLEYGELAICYAKDAETISLKNSNDDIVYLNIPKVNASLQVAKVNGISGEIINNVEDILISGSDINVGNYVTVEYPTPFLSANSKPVNVESGITISSAFTRIEKTISALTQEVLDDEVVAERAIEALGTAAGTMTSSSIIKYIPNINANYISGATSLANADDLLDLKIKELEDKIAALTNRVAALEA